MAQKGRSDKAWKQSRKAAGHTSRTAHRECGTCTACCHAPEIPWLDKAPFTACMHLKEGTGCAIYATRPKGCREFKCLWLASWKSMGFLTEDDRPDKLGIMICTSSGSAEHPGMDLWELRPGALGSDRARRIRAELRSRRCSITESRHDPESGDVKRTLVTPTIEGKPVFIKHSKWSDRGNQTFLFGS